MPTSRGGGRQAGNLPSWSLANGGSYEMASRGRAPMGSGPQSGDYVVDEMVFFHFCPGDRSSPWGSPRTSKWA